MSVSNRPKTKNEPSQAGGLISNDGLKKNINSPSIVEHVLHEILQNGNQNVEWFWCRILGTLDDVKEVLQTRCWDVFVPFVTYGHLGKLLILSNAALLAKFNPQR